MNQIFVIARLTFLDAIRNRIFYGVLFFMLALVLTATAISSITMGRTELMISDLGLAGTSILANLTAIVFSIQLLQQEKEGRNLYVLLVRLKRHQYLFGKFLGLSAMMIIQIVVMCSIVSLCILPFGQIQWLSFLEACWSTVLEVMIVISIAMLFAQASGFFLALLLSLAANVAGRFTTTIHDLGQHSDSALLHIISSLMYYALPNLELINLRNMAGYIHTYSADKLLHVCVYGLSETAFLLVLNLWIFSRKNLS